MLIFNTEKLHTAPETPPCQVAEATEDKGTHFSDFERSKKY